MKLLAFTNPVPGREDEFNAWYDEIHLRDVLNIPGVVGAQRYRLRPVDARTEPAQRYLVMFDVDGDVDELVAEMNARIGTEKMPMSDALDRTTSLMAFFEEI